MKKTVASALTLCVLGSACGPAGLPATSGTRESGQSGLMDKTFAGQNACNPASHDRPFIIEWDATDMSSFEALASSDLVVVKYVGCNLELLGGCKDDSIRGSLGTYKAVDWTSGSLEKVEISTTAELYAKLPLGVASLGGRVQGGEQFRMEYYVAGTRSATRPEVFASDLSKVPGCEGATHFVYGYNLGAFGLGSVTETSAAADASLYGFGAGASTSQKSSAEKKGGDLATCKSDSAKEIEGCKVPIRLTLRAVTAGENPEQATKTTPDTDASLNAAARLEAKIEVTGQAGEHWKSAQTKMNSRDGKGCLAELDQHDKLEPKHKSTDPKSDRALLRGQCLMLSGKCDAGKQLARKSLEANQSAAMGPEHVDRVVDAFASLHCQGAMQPRDALLKALQDLQQGAYMTKKDVASCKKAYDDAKRLLATVKPRDDDDTQVVNAPKSIYHMGANCAARAGDCAVAWTIFQDGYPAESLAQVKDPKQRETILQTTFGSLVNKCKK